MTEPARSYVADGRVVHWHPPRSVARWRFAIDAELADQPVPAALAHHTGISEPERFWPRWTAMEVVCKLRDVPVVRWLKRYGLDEPLPYGLTIVTGRHGDLVIARGMTATVRESALGGRIAVVDAPTARVRETGTGTAADDTYIRDRVSRRDRPRTAPIAVLPSTKPGT